MSSRALLIVDAQNCMFNGESAVLNSAAILDVLKNLLTKARANSIPVFFIQHDGPPGEPEEKGTEGWEIHSELTPLPGEVVIHKTEFDAFNGSDLETQLSTHGYNELIIAGMQTECCIESNCRKARKLGFRVVLVEDGHSTWDGGKERASVIVSRVNSELKDILDLKKAEQIFSN